MPIPSISDSRTSPAHINSCGSLPAPTPEGVPLEIYVFVKDKVWVNYEKIMSDIFDHLLAAIHSFDLECFEYTSEKSFSK